LDFNAIPDPYGVPDHAALGNVRLPVDVCVLADFGVTPHFGTSPDTDSCSDPYEVADCAALEDARPVPDLAVAADLGSVVHGRRLGGAHG